jgi:hypothetical protein
MTSNEPLDKNMILFGLIAGLIFIYIINHYNTVKYIPKPTQQTQTNIVVRTQVIDLADHNLFNQKQFRGPDPRYRNHVRFVKKPKVYYI